jgi:surface protein
MIKKTACILMFALLSLAAYADSEPYAVLSDDGQTVTFYYDGQKDSRGGIGLIVGEWGCSNDYRFVTTAIFDDSFAAYRPASTRFYFSNCTALTNIIGMNNLKTDDVKNMENMFYECSSLTSLDMSGFKTDNVTDMSFMFGGCSALTSLDVSGFKTDNVTGMGGMFTNCSGLTSLDVSGFKTDNVTNMSLMFYNCSGLTSLDVSGFKTDNVTEMSMMFNNCSGLTSLDVSSFKTDKVTDMSGLFAHCSVLTSLDVSGFKTDNVTDMNTMFYYCSGLTSLDVSGFKTDNVNNMEFMFAYCSNLKNLDVSGFKTDNVTDMCMMFSNCSGLTSLDVSGFRTDKVESMNNTFSHCSSLQNLDVSGFNTANVIDMTCMFNNCSKLRSLDLSNFNTENVSYMTAMFGDCLELTSLDLSSFNTSNVTTMKAMFSGCRYLGSIYANEGLWNTSQVDKDEIVFGNNDYLRGGNGTKYSEGYGSVEYARIDKLGSLGYLTAKSTLIPLKDQEEIDYGDDASVDKYSDLSGTIIDNIFYNIGSVDGGFDADDKCIVVNKAMTDEEIEAIFGKDIFSSEVKTNYAGIIIKVPQGNGKVTIQAQTIGGMMLMVKIGTADPVKKDLTRKQIVDFPYDVDRPAYVYIYAGMSDDSTATRTRGEQSYLRIYGLGISKESTSIVTYGNISDSADVYSIDGRLIKKSTATLQNLPKGIYIRNGKKYIIK